MDYPRTLPVTAAKVAHRPRNQQWTVKNPHQAPRPSAPRSVPLTRRYEVCWIDDLGNINEFMRVAPAMPVFEYGFNAFTHGALIATSVGNVAVEDLEPGMMLETASGAHVKLRWIGSMTIIPGAPYAGDEPDKIYRVMADSFGLARPAADVTFGPGARLLNRSPDIRHATGAAAALAPVAAFADGMSVIEIAPVSPTKVYHLALDSHEILLANGMEVESFHPGSEAVYSLTVEMNDLFISLFPHLQGIEGFGRMLWPRFDPANPDAE